ncbi:Oxygen sensor histidine kinase NreB [Methylophilaceae bacterium]|nr:Oxygen sensor histidine kinase NreB [Methylophilaceae bacterium]
MSTVQHPDFPWFCLTGILANLPGEIYILDANDFHFISASTYALREMNLDLAELQGLGFQDVFQGISPALLEHQVGLYAAESRAMVELFPGHHAFSNSGAPFSLLYIKEEDKQALIALPANDESAGSRESRIERIVSHVPCLVFELLQDRDQQISFKFLSSSCEALLGIPPSALFDNPGRLIDIIQQEDRQSFFKSMQRAAQSNSGWNWEGGIRIEKWQDIKLVNLRGNAVPYDEGRILWRGIITNISHSRNEKQELNNIIARFKTIVANIPSMVFECTLDETGEISFNYLSDACQTLLDLSPEQLMQHPSMLLDMVLPTDREKFIRSMRKSARELSVWNWEGAVWMEKWQDIKSVNLRATAIMNTQGQVQWGGVMTNITQSKNEKMALDEISNRFQAIVSNIPSLVFQCHMDPENRIAFDYLSDDCQALLGIPADMLFDQPDRLMEIILPEDRASFMDSMRQSAINLDVWNWEGRLWIEQWQDVKIVNLRASATKNAEGLVQWGGVITNITQNQREKMEIEESHRQLEELSSHMALVKEQERLRIAREIHDDLGGNLTSIKIGLASLIKGLQQSHPELIEKARKIESLVDQTFEDAHRITADLRPSVLELGIVAALEWQAKEFETQIGIPFNFSTNDEHLDLDIDRSIVLFRICQEASSNIAKYAKANLVDVELMRKADEITMQIIDDGVGIRLSDKKKKNAFGLRGMIERVQAVGGQISIEPGIMNGTKILVRLPL